jgi:hypothetical protein
MSCDSINETSSVKGSISGFVAKARRSGSQNRSSILTELPIMFISMKTASAKLGSLATASVR